MMKAQGGGSYPDYLSFTATGNSTIALTNNGGNAPIVYYSFDREIWTLWDYTAINLADGETVYMYGDNGGNGGRFSQSSSVYSQFSMTGVLDADGNIMALLGLAGFENYTGVGDYCFYMLFNGCNSLVSFNGKLQATTLTSRCYYSMFLSCSSLVVAPEVMATNTGPRDAAACYYMFKNCLSLTSVKAHFMTFARNAQSYFVNPAGPNGTLYLPTGGNTPSSGYYMIPNDWTIQRF